MDNYLFSKINCEFYTCHYELNPKFTFGLKVTVYAECSRNTTGVDDHYYYLDLFLSVDDIPVRDHIVGTTFGEAQMDKRDLDAELEEWVDTIVYDDSFNKQIKAYMRKERMWEEAQDAE